MVPGRSEWRPRAQASDGLLDVPFRGKTGALRYCGARILKGRRGIRRMEGGNWAVPNRQGAFMQNAQAAVCLDFICWLLQQDVSSLGRCSV